MKRIVKIICMVMIAVAAIPAAICFGLMWAVYRLADMLISRTERSRDEN